MSEGNATWLSHVWTSGKSAIPHLDEEVQLNVLETTLESVWVLEQVQVLDLDVRMNAIHVALFAVDVAACWMLMVTRA